MRAPSFSFTVVLWGAANVAQSVCSRIKLQRQDMFAFCVVRNRVKKNKNVFKGVKIWNKLGLRFRPVHSLCMKSLNGKRENSSKQYCIPFRKTKGKQIND